MYPQRRSHWFGSIVAGVIMAALTCAFPLAAGAATGGSGAPDTPASNGTGSGDPGGESVLCTVTAPAAGGTQSCSGVSVTEGATTDGLTIVFSTGTGPSCAVAPALTVAVTDPSTGAAYTGTLSLSVTYTHSGIDTGQTVLAFDGSSGGWVLPPSGSVSSGATAAGAVTANLTGDGSFVVDAATCSSAIAGATVAVTGKPFRAEEYLAGALVGGGLLALGLVLRRRPRRTTALHV
ncbi:MAG TPA: hypothetical protein VGG38_04840 [Acidimicrobiales bacterium]|jgi:hypothetical protein